MYDKGLDTMDGARMLRHEDSVVFVKEIAVKNKKKKWIWYSYDDALEKGLIKVDEEKLNWY